MEESPQSVMTPAPNGVVDPRTRRTRLQLQAALARLMETQDFERISVQEITEAAGVNRATFYAHYADKYALLECMVGSRFHALLDSRGVVYHGGCTNALRGIVLGVCDFLAQSVAQAQGTPYEAQGRPMQPHMETAIIAVVRRMILGGMAEHGPQEDPAGQNLRASAVSWAVYGAAREWVNTTGRAPSEEIATTVVGMVAPLLGDPTDRMPELPASA
jgi:AcrR family transcriptional regulator